MIYFVHTIQGLSLLPKILVKNLKFKTEKTGTGIGASSIDFENINADTKSIFAAAKQK